MKENCSSIMKMERLKKKSAKMMLKIQNHKEEPQKSI